MCSLGWTIIFRSLSVPQIDLQPILLNLSLQCHLIRSLLQLPFFLIKTKPSTSIEALPRFVVPGLAKPLPGGVFISLPDGGLLEMSLRCLDLGVSGVFASMEDLASFWFSDSDEVDVFVVVLWPIGDQRCRVSMSMACFGEVKEFSSALGR